MKTLNMPPHGKKGILLTFCGLDGCGKTTMLQRAMQEFKDDDIIFTKQPTPFVRESAIFRTYMDNPNHDAYDYRSLSLLAASDRVQHTSKVIVPALEAGKTVFSDRYFYSCLANLIARGYASDCWIYEIAKSIVKPDAAFFFDVPVSVAIERVRARAQEKDRYIDIELQYRLREAYLAIAKANNGILIPTNCAPDISYAAVRHAILHIKEHRKEIKA